MKTVVILWITMTVIYIYWVGNWVSTFFPMRSPCSTLLNIFHLVKMLLYSNVAPFHSIVSANSVVVWRKFSCKRWFNHTSSNSAGRIEPGATLRLKFPFFKLAHEPGVVLLAIAPSTYRKQMSRAVFAASEQ